MKKLGCWLAVCAGALAVAGSATAQERDRLDGSRLESSSSIKNMKVLAQHFPGELRLAKMQMMTVGDRRYLFHARPEVTADTVRFVGQIIDVTNPLKPVVVKDGLWDNNYQSGQVGFRKDLGRWILVQGPESGRVGEPGFRGVEIIDVTDPRNPTPLARWSVDGGAPDRTVQAGSGTHRNYYDGGRYAYLSTAPDDSFALPTPEGQRRYNNGLQIVDLQDPTRPRLASNWNYPGQRLEEAEVRAAWPKSNRGYFGLHGPTYVPQKVEAGGRLSYGGWGHFGMLIHDISDPTRPKLMSQWRPDDIGEGIPFHTVDVARLNRGFVIASWEAIANNCAETQGKNYIIDVRDPAKPVQIATLPEPEVPAGAPYKSFCERYGRYGTHNSPHLKAPGRADPNFTCYTFFSGGLQCYDISNPRAPFVTAYFVPKQGGLPDGTPFPLGGSTRTADTVFIEWDRRLIWVGTDSGLYLLSAKALGRPILKALKPKAWAVPGLNDGAP